MVVAAEWYVWIRVLRVHTEKLDIDLKVVKSFSQILQVSDKKAREWCASRGNIPYFETSAKEDCNVDEAFLGAAKTALTSEREQVNM